MSSRAAGGRKRLQTAPDSTPANKGSVKSFFSRNRSGTAPSQSAHSRNFQGDNAGHNENGQPYNDPFQGQLRRQPPPDQAYAREERTKNSNGHREYQVHNLPNIDRSDPADAAYFEASYQPPPPVHSRSPVVQPHIPVSPPPTATLPKTPQSFNATYQSQPLSVSPRSPSSVPARRPATRPMPLYPEKVSNNQDYPSSLPTPTSVSSGNSSLLLQSGRPLPSAPREMQAPQNFAHVDNRRALTNAKSTPSLNVRSPYNHPNQQNLDNINSFYPSPPSSSPGLVSPTSSFQSPSLSMLSLPLNGHNQDGKFSYQQDYATRQYVSPPRSPLYTQTPTISSTSHLSLHTSNLEKSSQVSTESAAPTGFVYPGSRSSARPKVVKPGTSRLKFGKSKKKDGVNETTSTLSSTDSLDDRRSHSSKESSVLQNQPSSTAEPLAPLRRPKSSAVPPFPQNSPGSENHPLPITKDSPAFVFPSSRSRATPGAATTFKFKSTRKTNKKDGENKSKFMGISIKKKSSSSSSSGPPSPMAHTLYAGSEMSPYGQHAKLEQDWQQAGQGTTQAELQRIKAVKSRLGSYPLDPYDSVLLDNDRHTGNLLRILNPISGPSFHDYSHSPPTTVLDLGCGQGHWALEAAIAWKGYGTKVTGFDMVDTAKSIWPQAVKQGVADNIRFIRGNFLKQRLPFQDNSFDLIRMSCLTYCITSESWEFVLQEVCRVMTFGGRLELIEDRILFPYGKALTRHDADSKTANAEPPMPMLDISIPSSTFSTYGSPNPNGRGAAARDYNRGEGDSGDLYDLYSSEDDSEGPDNATLNGHMRHAGSPPGSGSTRAAASFPRPPTKETINAWNQQVATSRDLEALFEHMMTYKFGIHIHPCDFLLDLLKQVFGHAQEMKPIEIMLAPPDKNRKIPLSPTTSTPVPSGALAQSAGLIVWPSRFLPIPSTELEIHATRHMRVLLSTKKFLIEHAIEATEDEEIDEDSILEALWEYEGFCLRRFNHPPIEGTISSQHMSADEVRVSLASVSSEGEDAMWEYQSDFRQRFAWALDRLEARTPDQGPRRPSPMHKGSGLRNPRDTVIETLSGLNITQPYSRKDLAHVRTFHIYEAIKMDDGTLG